ncbi:MAG TPA: alpha/beta hydrolase [Caulobacteraceae bacterium]|jgi:proline iminopeptidase|nr:alpha/beta hydrolase [Caulobacteraceae bacterium]
MFLTVNGARLFFDTVGSSLGIEPERMAERPALLVLHGGPGFDHSLMRPYFDRFADSHQVIYLDHRGNGRSEGEPGTWRLDQWADDIAAFCDTLGLVKPVVYGLSFGGMVAMAYAGRHPDHPSKLIFSSTATRLRLDTTYEMMDRLGGEAAAESARRFWSDPTPEGVADYMTVCMPLYNPSRDPAAQAAIARATHRYEVMFEFVRGEQRTMDLRPGLARVACPALILAGGLDPITPLACAEEILAALPDGVGRLEVFAAAGHGVHRDEPDRAEAVLRAFLQEGRT